MNHRVEILHIHTIGTAMVLDDAQDNIVSLVVCPVSLPLKHHRNAKPASHSYEREAGELNSAKNAWRLLFYFSVIASFVESLDHCSSVEIAGHFKAILAGRCCIFLDAIHFLESFLNIPGA